MPKFQGVDCLGYSHRIVEYWNMLTKKCKIVKRFLKQNLLIKEFQQMALLVNNNKKRFRWNHKLINTRKKYESFLYMTIINFRLL